MSRSLTGCLLCSKRLNFDYTRQRKAMGSFLTGSCISKFLLAYFLTLKHNFFLSAVQFSDLLSSLKGTLDSQIGSLNFPENLLSK